MIPYEQYNPVFRCALPHMVHLSKVFTIIGIAQSLLGIVLSVFTASLHAVPDYATLGYSAGFFASAIISFSSVFPFRAAASDMNNAAVLTTRFLQTRQPMEPKLLYLIASTDSLWFSHPTSRCVPSRETSLTASSNSSNFTNRVPIPARATQVKKVAPQMGCVIIGFDRLAKFFYSMHYFAQALLTLSITLSALFHVFDASLIKVDDTVASTIGIATGSIAALVLSISNRFSFQNYAVQCRRAYALSFEFWLTEKEIPTVVLDRIYSVNTLCWTNPIYATSCVQASTSSKMRNGANTV